MQQHNTSDWSGLKPPQSEAKAVLTSLTFFSSTCTLSHLPYADFKQSCKTSEQLLTKTWSSLLGQEKSEER